MRAALRLYLFLMSRIKLLCNLRDCFRAGARIYTRAGLNKQHRGPAMIARDADRVSPRIILNRWRASSVL